jgi:putative zinc finger/helix-turn-helix YgiT family protein
MPSDEVLNMNDQEDILEEKCPECGNGHLVFFQRHETFPFDLGKRTITVRAENVPIKRCPACGEEFLGPEAVKVREEAVAVAAGWYLTATEYKAIREDLGWSQQYLADLTGYGVATVSRAERGKLRPNLSYDITLRSIRDSPEYRENLERQYRIRTGEQVAVDAVLCSALDLEDEPTVVSSEPRAKYRVLKPDRDREVVARQRAFRLHRRRASSSV